MSSKFKDTYIRNHTYETIKDSNYIKINNVNPLYLIIHKVNGYFEEINKNKYLTLVPINERKKIIENMKKFGVKSEI